MLGLKIENISKSWSDFKLRNVNLAIEDGDYFILLGPTGAGKTLLLETIMGFHKPDEGRIVLNGQDVTGVPPEKRGVGYVSQNCVLFPHMDVRENVEFSLKMKGTPKAERNHKVNELLEFAGLKAMANRRPATLSGGKKQKVALMRAWAAEPQMIILDEPLTAIDLESAREIKNALKQVRMSGKTVIHVTHNQVEGFSLGSKMAIMNSGEIVQTGKPKEIFAKPRSTFVARFLGYENIFTAKLVEKQGSVSVVNVEGVKINVSGKVDAADCTVAVRPEDIAVDSAPTKNATMNVLKGTITEFVDQGPTVSITVEAALKLKVTMIKSFFIEKNLETGQEIWLAFRSEAAKIL
jgi:ABC-type Fe3+/spermidine/putrescine transport system ATPase subunit